MSTILLILAVLAPGLAQESEPEEEDDDPDEVIVVTGSRTAQALSETVVVTEVITRAEIEDSGAEDVADLLETESGVEITRTFRGAGVMMQGLDSKYVLILVDGKRVAGRTDGVIDLSRFPAERIERIEIVKGAASALYGSEAMGGVINIITRQPDGPFTTRTHASYGSRNTLDASVDAGFDRGDLRASGRAGWHMTDGYDLNPEDLQTNGPWIRQGSGDLSGSWKPTPQLEVEAAGSFLMRDSRTVYEAPTGGVFDDRNLSEEAMGRLGAIVLGESSKLTTAAQVSTFRNQFMHDQRSSSAGDNYEDSKEIIGQVEAQYDLVWGRQLISAGVEGLGERMRSPRLVELDEEGLEIEDDVKFRGRGAVFLQDEIRLGRDRQLAVVPSARLDYDTMFEEHFTPRLALRFDPVEDLALRLAAGNGYRAPSFREMYTLVDHSAYGYIFVGNPALEPETSFNVSGGVEWSPLKGLALRLDGFRNRLHDMITFAPHEWGGLYWTYQNIAEATTAGGEASVRYRLSRAVMLNLGYTYTWTWIPAAEQHLDRRAPHRGTAGLIGRYEPWGLDGTARVQVVGPTLLYLADGPYETRTYAQLNLRLEKSILPRRLRVFAGVDNLLDAPYQDDKLFIFIQPRTFYAGLTFDHPVPEDEP